MARENPRIRSGYPGLVRIRVVTTCQAIQPKNVVEEANPEESWRDFFLKCGITGCTVDDHIVCGGGPVWTKAFRKAEITDKIGDLFDGGNVKIIKGHYSVRIGSRLSYLRSMPKERRTPQVRLVDSDEPPTRVRPWVAKKAAKKRPDRPVLHFTPRRQASRAVRRQPDPPVLHSPPRRQAPRAVKRQPGAPIVDYRDRQQAPRTVKKRQVTMTRSHEDTEAVGPMDTAPPVSQREDPIDVIEVEDPPTNQRQDPASGRRGPAPLATRSDGGNASGQDDEEIIEVDNVAVARNPPPAPGRPVRLATSRPFRGGAQDVSGQRVVRRERSEPGHWKRIVQQRIASFSNNWLLRVAEETKRLQDNHLWHRNVAHMPHSCHFLQDLLEL